MNGGELILYTSEDGRARVYLRAEGGTVWLTQLEIAELFQTTKQNVSLHAKNILAERELDAASTVKDSLTVRVEGDRQVQRPVRLYNLNLILAIGYRVRSPRGTQFRQWATRHLAEYLVKGFVMNDERLKDPGGWDYFDELLERIRAIRASEKRFYQKIRDIYTTAVDYDARSEAAQLFFKKVQNKMLWAVTGRTAAELIADRANPAAPNMGLTAWKGAAVRKADVAIAKNYLAKDEIAELDRIVTMYLDFAEDQASRRHPMHMAEWVERLDAFLQFNERNVLTHAGTVSHELAEQRAHAEFETYDAERRRLEAEKPTTDFDRAVEEVKRLEAGTRKGGGAVRKAAKKKASRRGKPKGGEA